MNKSIYLLIRSIIYDIHILALRWGQAPGGPGLRRALQAITSGPAHVLGAALGSLQASLGRLTEGGMADVCVFNPQAR